MTSIETATSDTEHFESASDRRSRWALLLVSAALAAAVITWLVTIAGAWEVAANSRVLNLLLRSGIVQLTDMDAGYVAGVPDVDLFLRSRDAIDWLPLVVATALIVGALAVRAARARAVTGAIVGSSRHLRVLRIHLRAQAAARFVPFGLEQEHERNALNAGVTSSERVSAAIQLQRHASGVELAVYAVVALALIGFRPWIEALAWASVILAIAVLLGRPSGGRRQRRLLRRRRVASALASLRRRPVDSVLIVTTTLVALPLEELAAYLTVQALSSQHVILGGATPSVLLLAIVAGKLAAWRAVTPGGLGQYELAMAAALVTTGQGVAEAVTITLAFTAVRYLAASMVLGATTSRRRSTAIDAGGEGNGDGARHDRGVLDGSDVGLDRSTPRPDVASVPTLASFARRLFVLGCVLLALFLLGRLRGLLVDYWLLESLGFEEVFWTNARMGALLFVVAGVAWFAAILVPWLVHRRGAARVRLVAMVALVVGVLGGTYWAGRYETFLLWRHGVSFGETDPVFGHDISFYVFDLPAIHAVVWGTFWLALFAAAMSAYTRMRAGHVHGFGINALARACADRWTSSLLAVAGTLAALGLWLRRYDVLLKDNESSSIATGAEAVDVSGALSTVNLAWVHSAAVLALTVTVIVALRRTSAQFRWRHLGAAAIPWLALAILATGLVAARDAFQVTPNEPVSQLSYLRRHIDATNRAWGLDAVERVDLDLNSPADPPPDLDRLLDHPSVRNAQLWPASASWLERLLDPQHVERILLEADQEEPDLVFGTTLDTFRQQQQLRPYYDFLDVDVARYTIDGRATLVTSAVRELPLLEPQPWLAFWGQRFVLFTHGYGLVAAPVGAVSSSGGPEYVSSEIPPVTTDAAIETQQASVYYGEGAGTIGFSNVRGLAELDFPTAQDRADVVLPTDVDAGIRMDSWLKRLAFAWGTRELFGLQSFVDLAMSDLITHDTRIHYRRQPLDRLATVAPFLFLDADPYAVATGDGITWMVNGMTVTDRYPYSAFGELGDKSVRRGPFPGEPRRVNYAADSVKATVDAYTGAVTLYRISDEPVIATWAAIYPDLFTPATEMPDAVRAHLQYPPQLFHVQFDDLWIYYHVTDPIAFFNQEDVFDDADEVLGPMHMPGKGITFSMEPYPSIIETGTAFPGSERQLQFAWSQIFTPEAARNLRAIITVYQDGEDYGRLSMLQLPKGSFVLGPEQAEAVIDQDDEIAQQFGFWNATGVEVIRGYLTPLIIDGELIYIEPVFIRSEQNAFPQLSRVVAVARGEAAMGETLTDALQQVFGG
jgi:uncharacterized membrane protein (UPF0182 family)